MPHFNVSRVQRTGTRAAQAAPPQHEGTLTLLLPSEPTSLVTINNVATPILSVSAKVTEGLLKYDYDVNPQPQLATKWAISRDGLSYTFTLRQGVKWHDGKDFTSADVAYSIELLKKIHPRGRNTFANLSEIETPDKHTVVLRLSKPAPYLIRALVATETPIVPRHIYEGTDPASNPNNTAPIGTGPFRFKEWVRGSHIVYERNADYWDKPKPFVDQLVVRVVNDPAAASVAFETNTVDLGYRTPVPLADLERLKQLKTLRFETKGNSYSHNVTRLEFNLDNEYFKRPEVRQAVAHAVDRSVILKVVNYGYGKVSYSPIAPGLKAYHDPAPFIKRIYTERDFAFTTNGASNLFDPTVGVQRLYWSKNFIKGVPFSNGTHYNNPVVDKLLEDAAVENDPVRRVKLFKDFQDTVARDVPDLNLFQPEFITIAHQRVHEHSVTADGVEGNLADAWVDPK